jgi:SAM-dependent methyltransferase
MTGDNKTTKSYYEAAYQHHGLDAQRRYPNEELCRFVGRHYLAVPRAQRAAIRILEVGCGSGANLWMIAREGFDAYGVDLSDNGVELCQQMLARYGVSASLRAADMAALPFQDQTFDCVVDVFSSYCLDEQGFDRYLDEVARLLKPDGLYFSYAPSKRSDAFLNHAPAAKIDASTLDGIRRETSPFYGNLYPFRFVSGEEYAAAISARRLTPIYNERVGRTYRGGEEYFEFVVIAARKSGQPY